jgi:cyclase
MRDGRVVKGIKFVDIKDAGDPAEAARFYSEAGADELVLLDINASHEGRATTLDVVARTAEQASVPFCVGGGISSVDQIGELFRVGADKVSVNTPAVQRPEFIAEAAARFGSGRIVAAIDVKKTGDGRWEVYINGGRTPTARDAVEWALETERMGAGEILLTSMETDGARLGYDLEITRKIADAVKIPVVASGGAGCLKDFSDAVTAGHADAMLAASLFHFRVLEVGQVKEYLRGMGIPVRIN